MIAGLNKYFVNIPTNNLPKADNYPTLFPELDNDDAPLPKFMSDDTGIDYLTLLNTIFGEENDDGYHIDFNADKWDFAPFVKNGNKSALYFDLSKVYNKNIATYLKYYSLYLLSLRVKPSSVCLKIRQLRKLLMSEMFIESLDVKAKCRSIMTENNVETYIISILETFIDFCIFLTDNFDIDFKVDFDEMINEMKSITTYENKYPLIPWEYFNKMMKVAQEVQVDENKPIIDRIIACALVIQMQSGLRTTDLLSLKIDDLIISKDGDDTVFFLNFYQNKTSKFENESYLEIDVSKECGKAFEMAQNLRFKPKQEYSKFLFILKNGNKVEHASYYRLYHHFMVTYLKDEIIKPWENIEKRKLRVTDDGKACNIAEKQMEAYVPYPHSFRVNICTMITESHMYTRKYCMKHLGHLSAPLDDYYCRPKDRTPEINRQIADIVGNMVRHDVSPIGGRNDGDIMTKNIQKFLGDNGKDVIDKHILPLTDEELVEKLGGRLTFNPVAGGCCIKVGTNSQCNLYGNDNSVNCAYGQCENVYYFFFNLPETVATFRMTVNAYNVSAMKKMTRQMEKTNRSARNLASRIAKELEQLELVKDRIDGFTEKYPQLTPYINDINVIRKEIEIWL